MDWNSSSSSSTMSSRYPLRSYPHPHHSGWSSTSNGFDPDVIEIDAMDVQLAASAGGASSSGGGVKKRKRAPKVFPQDIIDIDDDEDTLFIDEKVNEGNSTSVGFQAHDNSWTNAAMDFFPQQPFTPAASNFSYGIPQNSLQSFGQSFVHGFDIPQYLNNVPGFDASLGAEFQSGYPQYHYNNGNVFGNYFETLGLQQPQPFPLGYMPPVEMPIPWVVPLAKRQKNAAVSNSSVGTFSLSDPDEEIMKKYKAFKQFDTVQNCSDHHYFGLNCHQAMQPAKTWSKKIQQQWSILENDLPDSIFVRVYEDRMDLLRAVIIGAAGTPYHDGLFFFDFYFPPSYPNVPPKVYYHSGGLRLNPNLYNCGKVCLSLLNTWQGDRNQMWIPNKSTVLQVLLSIQALVLNAKPYFNEPGYASTAGQDFGEKQARDYNENTFILSCRTMLYTMNKPPKYFEDLVIGHFREWAHAILVSCKAYIEGAQVGCLVGGGVQDLEEGDKPSSPAFRTQVSMMVKTLVPAFAKTGAKGCEEFLYLAP